MTNECALLHAVFFPSALLVCRVTFQRSRIVVGERNWCISGSGMEEASQVDQFPIWCNTAQKHFPSAFSCVLQVQGSSSLLFSPSPNATCLLSVIQFLCLPHSQVPFLSSLFMIFFNVVFCSTCDSLTWCSLCMILALNQNQCPAGVGHPQVFKLVYE